MSEKSNLLKMLEEYGTGARSAVSSATLGLSEPIISGTNAAIGSLISAGFDAKDAADFVKKLTDSERFKQEYDRDVKYRNQMKEEHPISDVIGSAAGAFSPLGPAAAIPKLTAKGAAETGKALYRMGALQKLGSLIGNSAAKGTIKTGLGAAEGATMMPMISVPESEISKLTGFSDSTDSISKDAVDSAVTGSTVQGGTKGGIELFKFLKNYLKR